MTSLTDLSTHIASLWERIAHSLSSLASGAMLSQLFESRPERSVGFTIAVIALGAKMAKADGVVTRDEVTAFRQIFVIPPHEHINAARVFDLARKDVAGYDAYARKIKRMFGAGDPILEDLLEGLLHIALADGELHEKEDAFLRSVASIFEIKEQQYQCLKNRVAPQTTCDSYAVLGVSPEMPLADIRQIWRKAVKDNHPDLMLSRGVPREGLQLAEKRMIAINAAWEKISQAKKEIPA